MERMSLVHDLFANSLPLSFHQMTVTTEGVEGCLDRLVRYAHFTSQQSLWLAPYLLVFAMGGAAWKVICCTTSDGDEGNTNTSSSHHSKGVPPRKPSNAQSSRASQGRPKSDVGAATRSASLAGGQIGAASLPCQQEISSAALDHQSFLGVFMTLALAWVFYLVVWHGIFSNIHLANPMAFGVHARFWMQPNLLLCPMLSLGACFLACSFQRIQPQKSPRQLTVWGVMAPLIVMVLIHCCVTRSGFSPSNQSEWGWTMHRYAQVVLDSLPPHSLLLSHTDLNWNTIRYLQVKHERRSSIDLLLDDHHPNHCRYHTSLLFLSWLGTGL